MTQTVSLAISRSSLRDRLRQLDDIGSVQSGELTRFAEVGISLVRWTRAPRIDAPIRS